MVTQGVAARRTQHDGVAATHTGRRYGSGHGIASGHGRRHHAIAVVIVRLVQMFGLAATAAATMHVAVGRRHGEMHFFHGRPFGFGGFTVAVREFHVFEQRLKPFQRSRGGRHLNGEKTERSNRNNNAASQSRAFFFLTVDDHLSPRCYNNDSARVARRQARACTRLHEHYRRSARTAEQHCTWSRRPHQTTTISGSLPRVAAAARTFTLQ